MANFNALLTPGANPGAAFMQGASAAQDMGAQRQRMNMLAQQENRTQQQFSQNRLAQQREADQQDQAKKHQLEIAAASAMAYSPQPKADAERFYPEFVAQLKANGQWDAVTDDQVRQQAMQELRYAQAQAGQAPERLSLEDQFKADQAMKLKQMELEAAGRTRADQQSFSARQAAEQRAFTAAENERNRAVQTRGQDLTNQAAATRANNANAINSAQNQKTWDTYRVAMDGLRQAMAATDTGPMAGRLPAVTSAQQTAEGAESAMAPVLKQIFRVAGEGTFTDKDQELLMKMVPTRKDSPQAREAKIQNIDNIVKSKLGIGAASGTQPAAAGQPASGGWSVRQVR